MPIQVVLCTISPGQAEALARTLVEERLAACVNILPVRSVYRWQGALEVDTEETMLIKVSAEGVEALQQRVLELHPYALPEFVVLQVDAAASLGAYVDWVRSETA